MLRHAPVHAQAPEQNQITVYSPQTSYSVPLLDVKGQPYIGLVELLEPLGSVDARPDGKKYKLRFTPPGGRPEEMQFTDGKDKAKVRGRSYKLPQPSRCRTAAAMSRWPQSRICWKNFSGPRPRSTRRGDACLSAPLRNTSPWNYTQGNPSRLLVGFASAVNPTIATEPGRVRLTFRREPVAASGPDNVTYNDPLITGASFSEHDGIAELDITGTAPLMANFADGGKTIIVTGAPPPPPPVARTSAGTAATGCAERACRHASAAAAGGSALSSAHRSRPRRQRHRCCHHA